MVALLDFSAGENGRSNGRIRRPEISKSLAPGIKDRIGRVETRQVEDSFYLAPQRTNSKAAALAADLPSGEKQLSKASAGHIIEPLQVDEHITRILALQQGLYRISQVLPALRVQPPGYCQDSKVAIAACMKRGHFEWKETRLRPT